MQEGSGMKIESYGYGMMTVEGKEYRDDLILFPDRVRSGWWRKEGHTLRIEDLKEVLNYKPEVLVVGKGTDGMMYIPLTTRLALMDKHVELIAKDTFKAVQFYNEQIAMGRDAVGAFHLTC
jgi:hypothetical protein